MIKNLFFFKRLNYLGGTEQFLYEIAKKYHGKFHIAVAYEEGSTEQALRLHKYIDVIKWHKGMKVECEKAFLNFNIDIIDDLICDDITFVCHANFEQSGYKPPVHPRIKRCIAVSDFTKEIYQKHYVTPCERVYNPIIMEEFEKPLILMSAFRADDPVRGSSRCARFARMLDKYCVNHGKRYLWFIFSSKPSSEIKSPNVVIIEPRVDVRAYMKMADWGVNLPNDMETYGYTNVEFLLNRVPIITTPLTVCEELKMDSSMRLVLDYDLSNAHEIIEQMFTKKMKFSFSPPEDGWGEILAKGKGETDLKTKMYKVMANNLSYDRGIHLLELGRPARPFEEFVITEDRVDNLIKGNNIYKKPFAVIIEEVPEKVGEMDVGRIDKRKLQTPDPIPEKPIKQRKPRKKE